MAERSVKVLLSHASVRDDDPWCWINNNMRLMDLYIVYLCWLRSRWQFYQSSQFCWCISGPWFLFELTPQAQLLFQLRRVRGRMVREAGLPRTLPPSSSRGCLYKLPTVPERSITETKSHSNCLSVVVITRESGGRYTIDGIITAGATRSSSSPFVDACNSRVRVCDWRGEFAQCWPVFLAQGYIYISGDACCCYRVHRGGTTDLKIRSVGGTDTE